MKPIASMIRQLLIDELALGTESGDWPVYTASLPNKPDDAIAVYDTSGMPDGRLMTGKQIIHEGIQVRVRAQSYPVGFSQINDIATAFETVCPITMVIADDGTYTLLNLSRRGDIIYLGQEEGDIRRYDFTLNVTITRRKES